MNLFTVIVVLMMTPSGDTMSPAVFHVIAPNELEARARVIRSGYIPSRTPHCVLTVFADHISPVYPRHNGKELVPIRL